MKNKNLNTRFLIVLVLLLGACKEKPVIIPDFSVPKGDRNVLIEEFTGVRCVNCPNGAKIIEEMVAEFGDRVVPISIHHGFFAKPLKQSKSDLNCHCGYGDAVTETLGKGPIGYPAAVINRQKLGSKLFPNKNEWEEHRPQCSEATGPGQYILESLRGCVQFPMDLGCQSRSLRTIG